MSKPLAGGWVSNIFLVPKKEPGKYWLILNLKSLNEHVEYTKFKVDHIEQVLNMIFPGAWLSSVDLTQAFNHIKISSKDYRYLMFTWHGQFYCYTCAPNGLSNCPYMFSKICKPLLGHLRRNLVDILIYIDDTILVADSVDKMRANVRLMLDCFHTAGFIVNSKKSCLEPQQCLTFLGFVIDTVKYTISLTDEKRHDIHGMTLKILHNKCKKFSIKFIAKLVGKIVALFPSSEHAPLHYRPLDRFKIQALLLNNNNWNAKVQLDHNCLRTVQWWHDNVFTTKLERSLHTTPVDKHLYCDSSGQGWGSYIDGVEAKSVFAQNQLHLSINSKELLAVYYGLLSHIDKLRNKHVLIYSDNFTTVSTLKTKSSSDRFRDRLVVKIFEVVFNNNLTVSVSFIRRKHNYFADHASRSLTKNFHTEWGISPDTLTVLCHNGLNANIDLFASHLNHILPKFCSWYPCPGTYMVDCFNLDWSQFNGYIFRTI